MKRIRLTITRDDLDTARYEHGRRARSMSCPIAQALRRRYPDTSTSITVGRESANIRPADSNGLRFDIGRSGRNVVDTADAEDDPISLAGTVVVLTDRFWFNQ